MGFLSGSAAVGGTEHYLRDLAVSIDEKRFEAVILRRPPLASFFAVGRSSRIACVDLWAWEPARTSTRRAAETSTSGTTGGLGYLGSAAVPVVKQVASELNRPLLGRVLARQGLDLLHVHNGGHLGSPIALGAVLESAELGIPNVLTVHSMAQNRGVLRRAEERFDRRLAGAASVMTTVGKAPAQALTERRGFASASIRIITTGIRASAVSTTRSQARAVLGMSEMRPVIGSIAAFIPVKGHMAMLESFGAVHSILPEVRVVLAGDGPCRSMVAQQAARIGLAEVVVLPGSVDPYATLAAFDVFVSASTAEGLPLSILEAMSQGVPVVATAVGAVPEVVIHGETGFLVAPGDTDSLARRLGEVLADPALARRLGDAARRRFEARHRINDMVAAYERLYHEVLDQPQ